MLKRLLVLQAFEVMLQAHVLIYVHVPGHVG